MARKPAHPRLKHTGEFVDDDGKPNYIERRGLREFKTPLSKQARSDLLPRVQNEAQILSLAASEILKRVGEKTLSEVLDSIGRTKPKDVDAAIKTTIVRWDFDISKRYGILSPVTLAADFLGGMYLIPSLFAVRPAGKPAHSALPDMTRHLLQLFAFADTWHWLHMEVHGAHRLALDGARSAENLRAAAPARTEKRKNAWR
jgi:hypothetical protein